MLYDLRRTCRSLAAAPSLTISVIVLVALGVGATAAVFSVANELFLRPPAHVADPSAVRRLYLRTTRPIDRSVAVRPSFPYPAVAAIANALGSRAAVTAYIPPDSAAARIGDVRVQVLASYVTPNFFVTLGTALERGRSFDAHADPTDASQPTAVISYDFWQSHFGGNVGVLGNTIEVTNQRYTIIGIAARGFSGVDLNRADIWMPAATRPWQILRQPWYTNWRGQYELVVLTRAARETGGATVASIATTAYRRAQLSNGDPLADTAATILAGPLLESLAPTITLSPPTAIILRLIGAAIILLIVSCANVANLLLLRSERRRKEIALRLALGISRRRLFIQLLTESVVLASAGAVAAIFVAAWGGALLRAAIMPTVEWATSALDARVAAVAIGTAFVTGMIAGLVPGMRAVDLDLVDSLKSVVGSGTHRSRLRTMLVVVQGAFSVVLLVGAGLFVRSLRAVESIDLGYDVSRIVYGDVWYRNPTSRALDYSRRYDAQRLQGFREVAASLRNTANVEDVALATAAPMAGSSTVPLFFRDGRQVPQLGRRPSALIAATPNFMRVTGLRLARGRWFQDDDQVGSPPVIVINEAAARAYWPDHSALGECLIVFGADSSSTGQPQAGCATVVGVVRDSHVEDIIEAPVTEVFLALAQQTVRSRAQPSVVIARARAGRTMQALSDLRLALVRAFPNADPPDVVSMVQAHDAELRPWRLGAQLFALLGIIALIVATFGMYSAMAYVVSQRTRELGVRIALGAQRRRIVTDVVASGARPLAAGLAIGLCVAIAFGRLVETMLYATTPRDPLTLAAVSLLLLASGIAGMLAPTYRALRVDPMTALRAE
jgi:putative ABC transport system permease protein